MSGLRLASMEFSDMLDVLHYFFEDDVNFSTAEQAEARDNTRSAVYENLYNSTYKYGAKSSRPNSVIESGVVDFDQPEEKMPEPFNPAVKPKPYRAPTKFDPESSMPFGDILDAPLEH